MRIRARTLIVASLVAVVTAHVLLLAEAPYALQSLAMLTLCALIPGVLLVDVIVGRGSAPPTPLERAALSVGVGYGALVVGMLLLSYIPGSLLTWHVYVVYDVLILGLLALVWYLERKASGLDTAARSIIPPDIPHGPSARWLIFGLIAVIVVGAVLRLGNLGYAEFHGDEARAVLRAAAVIQGYDDVLMLHKKGPAEILLPTATFALTSRVTETTARLPFALAGLTALLAIYLLGRRMFGPLAGWAAAMLLAVEGYAVAFSRIVQYQSIVILTSALIVLILYRLLKHPAASRAYMSLAAILFATGLMAHYEAALVALPALYLLVVLWRRHPEQRSELTRSTLVAAAISAGLLALFYAPYVTHPQFRATFAYLTQRRIGVGGDGGPLYNNLADFFARTTVYNSTYFVVFLIALTVAGLVIAYRRGLGNQWGSLAGIALIGGLTLTLWQPGWLIAGGYDLTLVFYAAAFGLAWAMPKMKAAERTLWLWYGALFLLALFLTAKPRTHVYVFVTPWVLIAGMALERGWLTLRHRVGLRAASAVGAGVTVVLTLLFGAYTYIYFVHTNIEVLRTWQQNRPKIYWTAYDMPDNHALFGFPLTNGWKVAGQLYAQGEIVDAYSTNEFEFWTPAWYTRGQWRCEDRADWFFQIANFQPDPEGYAQAINAYVSKEYVPWAQVTIDDDPRMVIHQRGHDAPATRSLALEEYETAFDAAATAYLPLSYPVVEPVIAHPLHANLGDAIWLKGYELAYDAPLKPGDTFELTLYWRGQRPIEESYKVFNQSFFGDGTMVAQQDGYPVCGARGTWRWDPGELIVDTHIVAVEEDAPSGVYPLYTGMYIQETGDRLDVLDEAGNVVGGQVHITDIQIGE